MSKVRKLFDKFDWSPCEYVTDDCVRVQAQEAGNDCAKVYLYEYDGWPGGYGAEVKGIGASIISGVDAKVVVEEAERAIREALQEQQDMANAAGVGLGLSVEKMNVKGKGAVGVKL